MEICKQQSEIVMLEMCKQQSEIKMRHDTRYSAKGTKGKWTPVTQLKGPKGNGDRKKKARLKCATYRR